MKIIFLPDIPDLNNQAICNKLKELINNDTSVVFYLTQIQSYLMAIGSSYGKELSNLKNIIPEGTEKNRILVVAPNRMILEIGDLYNKDRLKTENLSCKYAVPGNYTYDFIPTTIKYFQKNKIAVEDMIVVLENNQDISAKKMRIEPRFAKEEKEYSRRRANELEIYTRENKIKCLNSDSNWENCILGIGIDNDFEENRNLISKIDLNIITHSFFEKAKLPHKFSILFADRDKTFKVSSFEETTRNFELIKAFLEDGNLMFVITSGNHETTLFQENAKIDALWKSLSEYKDQVIGFPAFQAGVTLGDTKIPVGHAAIFKNGVIEKVIEMLLEKGYEVENVFSIGDAAIDLDMIIETAIKFNGVGYHIRENDDVLAKFTGLNHLTEEEWEYIKTHGIKSFEEFMVKHVLANSEKQKMLKR